MNFKIFFSGCCIAVLLSLSCNAAQYVITSSNVSDGVSDQIVVDNTGSAVLSGASNASLGYFSTINDPSGKSVITLAGDFVALGTSLFNENGGSINGLFDISNTISDAESNSAATNGNGRKLYLFIGNNSVLGDSTNIGLVDTGQSVPDVTQTASSFASNLDYTSGQFANGGTIIHGQLTTDNADFGGGNSNGTFQLVAVPEPSSTALLGLGGLALILRRRR